MNEPTEEKPDATASDTPRTDPIAFLAEHPDQAVVPADFARQLERELNEAQRVNDGYLENANNLLGGCGSCMEIICCGSAMHPHAEDCRLSELSTLRAEVAKVTKERDALAEWQEKWRSRTVVADKKSDELFVSMSEQLERAFAERDAALAKLESIKQLAAAEIEAFKAEAEQDRAQLAAARDDSERMRTALTRLRDCNWTISLPDRMDAVRDIARVAIDSAKEGQQ